MEAAHQMGLVPVLWLAALALIGHRRGAAWWWLASALSLSWVVEWLVHRYGPSPLSPLYLVTQGALIGSVLLPRDDALWFLGLLAVAMGLRLLGGVPTQPDLLVHTVAWWGIVLMVWHRPTLGRLRLSLLVSFGLGWLAWFIYVLWPDSPGVLTANLPRPSGTWEAFQLCRAVGIGLWCWAAWKPAPTLRIA